MGAFTSGTTEVASTNSPERRVVPAESLRPDCVETCTTHIKGALTLFAQGLYLRPLLARPALGKEMICT